MRIVPSLITVLALTALFNSPGSAAASTVAGPLSGQWEIRVNGKDYTEATTKPGKSKTIFTVTITDSPGVASQIDGTGVDGEGTAVSFTGQRIRQAIVLGQFGGTGGELFRMFSGTATIKKDIATKLSGTGFLWADNKTSLLTFTGKRVPQ